MKEKKFAEHIERHYRCYEMVPMDQFTYRGIKYVVAASPDPHVINYPTTDTEREVMREFPNGFYQIAWSVFRGEEPWIGWSGLMDKYHDPMYSPKEREQMRVKEARRVAEQAIDDGIYDTLQEAQRA